MLPSKRGATLQIPTHVMDAVAELVQSSANGTFLLVHQLDIRTESADAMLDNS